MKEVYEKAEVALRKNQEDMWKYADRKRNKVK